MEFRRGTSPEIFETPVPLAERRSYAIDYGRDRSTLPGVDAGARRELANRVDEPLRLRLTRGGGEHQRARRDAQITTWHRRSSCGNREILPSWKRAPFGVARAHTSPRLHAISRGSAGRRRRALIDLAP